jgi:hypothetical protein
MVVVGGFLSVCAREDKTLLLASTRLTGFGIVPSPIEILAPQ